MGLDVTFWKNPVLIDYKPNPRDDDGDDVFRIFTMKGFEDHHDPLPEGYYRAEEVAKFYAGSYCGYGEWRNALCMVVNGMTAEDLWQLAAIDKHKVISLQFYWLIDFADNEGVIAGDAFKKIAADFENVPRHV